MSQWAEKAGWKIDGEFASIPGNGDNDVKAGVVKEHVELGRELNGHLLIDTPTAHGCSGKMAELTMIELTKLIAAAAY